MTAVLFQWSLKNYKQGAKRLEKRNYLKSRVRFKFCVNPKTDI